MAALKAFVALLTLAGRAHPAFVSVRADDVTLNLEPQLTGGFQMVLIQDDERTVFGQIGRTLMNTYTIEEIDGGVEVQMGGANLSLYTIIDQQKNARGIKVRWNAGPLIRLEDCISFGSKHWYAGPMQIDQIYPIEKAEQRYAPCYSKEEDNGAIVERYWLNSAGEYIIVHPDVPLFLDYNNLLTNHICFGAQIAHPYSSGRNHTELSYDVWFLSDVKQAHKHAVDNYLGKPSGVPDYRMVQHPIWSTWAQYSQDIYDSKLIEFAQQIREHGFSDSQYEIDDLWEVCYGSMTVDEQKFPNFTKTIQDIKALGYRVTIWVHPFINKNCDPWYTEALESGYFVLDESGSPDASWWNNNGTVAGYVDFTNPDAAEWFYQRIKNLIDTYDIDSLKFDAGESSFTPQTVTISKKYTELHAAYAEDIYAAMQASVADGAPVNAPLWWLDPHDEDALEIWDEYLLGEHILVAPVFEEGAVSRDVYLPEGTWLEEGDPERVHIGPTWIRGYPAPLDVLPYFVKERHNVADAAIAPRFAVPLVLCGLLLNFIHGFN